MLRRIALLGKAAPRRIVAVAALVLVGAALYGVPVSGSLPAGGFFDPTSESAEASALLAEKFQRSDTQLVLELSSEDGAAGDTARRAGTWIADFLFDSPDVSDVTSAWTAPAPAAEGLISEDGRSGLIVAGVIGGEELAPGRADMLAQEVQAHVSETYDGVTLRAGGTGIMKAEATELTERDLLRTEMIALPLSFLVTVWVFGGLLAAALPMAVGLLAIAGSMSVLRLISLVTDVSIFALNVTVALGLALAIDYTLLIISRYRDELADGTDPDRALIRTMQTAGRTVLFSAVTVALSMSVMVIFPMYFLKSFAYAGVATVALAATAAILVTPAAIVLLGPRINALDVRRLARRVFRRPDPRPRAVNEFFWYRASKFISRRAVPVALAAVAFLVLLGIPFLSVRWGFPDDRVLPTSSPTHQLGDQLRNSYTNNLEAAVSVVIPNVASMAPAELERYGADLSRVADVTAVSTPKGVFVDGLNRGPPVAPTGVVDGSALLTVDSHAPLFTDASQLQLDRLHAVARPDGLPVQMTGIAMVNSDSVKAITSRMPLALALIAAITLALLFVLTGSVLLPVKALVLNLLSLTATFGALVWVFQEGHLGALGTTPSGTLVANVPVLVFCIAFGLAMDYEVFLMTRIQEYWSASAQTRAANDESVALGLARTARVITAAALVMLISFAALSAAQVSFIRMIGVGLALAILVDVSLVRLVLVPAFMNIAGRWNWWAPGPLVRLHNHIGLNEQAPEASFPDREHRPSNARSA